MKILYSTKKHLIKATGIVLFALTLFIIHSCRKDLKSDFSDVTDPDVQQAMAWYKSTYPLKVSINKPSSNIMLASVGNKSTSADLTQYFGPDWHTTRKYNRFNKNVIEMPIDPSTKMTTGLRNFSNNKLYANVKNSKTSYLILKDGNGYKAYIMTIIADSTYLKGDFNKLARNTYGKRDTDFSGLVLYFTPKGAYVNGYAYKNGNIVTSGAAGQSTSNKTLQSNTDGKHTAEVAAQDCTDWFIDEYQDDVLIASYYIGTTCDGSTVGGGGGGGGAPAPPPCPTPPANPDYPDAINTGKTINQVAPVDNPIDPDDPGSGGMPPPDPQPCVVVIPSTIKNNLKDPCLIAVLEKMRNGDLTGKMASIINDVFDNSTKFNLNFIEYSDNSNNAAPAKSDVPTINGGVYNETIEINTGITNGAAQEFDAVIMMHEVLHSYMNANNQFYLNQFKQHQEMAEKYVGDMKFLLQQMYSISEPDAYSLIMNGLADIFKGNTPAYYDTLKKNYGVTDPGAYETYRGGVEGTKCNP